MVYGAVKQHNGLIHVRSTPGAGSTFQLYLPMVQQPPEALTPETEVPVAGGNETILVAEDEEPVRSLVCCMLEGVGYTVLAAANGEEALRILGAHPHPVHLAVLDVVMPGMSGREVMDRIHARYPQTRFLFSSGYSADAIHSSFIIKEGLHLIPKPYRRTELLIAVREVLDKPHEA
jgi:CheY-like chemotaxis protein